MYSTNLWLFTELQNYLTQAMESKSYFSKKSDFTRDRIFTFPVVLSLILDLPRKSLSVELFDGQQKINELLNRNQLGGKSGFCKARKKIKFSLFRDLFKHQVNQYYTHRKDLKTWKGFILEAIDGSILDILNLPVLQEKFGFQKNQHSQVAQGRMMIGHDILNNMILECQLGHLSIGESTVARNWMIERSLAGLKIYDRNFAGLTLQFLHDYHRQKYVIRCKLTHNNYVKKFLSSGEKQSIQIWHLNQNTIKQLKALGLQADLSTQTTITVRLVRVELENGEVEILLTNLLDQTTYPHSCFQELYNLRWGVETVIDFLKNVLQIEISSGCSDQLILQDFFASILRANLQSLIEQDAQQKVEAVAQKRNYKYKINRNVACGILKNRIHSLILKPVCEQYYDFLVNAIGSHILPIRKHREVDRSHKRNKQRGKYRTLGNYKRAI